MFDLPTFLSDWLGLLTAAQQQAAITGLFQMLGVLVTGILAVATFVLTQWATRKRDERLHRSDIEREEARRRERTRDLQIALRSEIRVFVSKYANFDLDHHRDVIVEKIRSGNPAGNFTPFVPKMTDQFIWDAMAEDIPILPAAVIDPVILYYDMLKALALLVEDMRSSAFRQLEPGRKAAVYEDYMEMLRKLTYHATQALSALDAQLNSLDRADQCPDQAYAYRPEWVWGVAGLPCTQYRPFGQEIP